jgi:hypothetical protein
MVRIRRSFLIACSSLLLLGSSTEQPALERLEIESFLRSAKVIDREALDIGVTHSYRLTLTDGSRTLRAVWKTIDESVPLKRFESGLPEVGFVDSYKNEVAAYELDSLIGLDMVPPTVERRIGRKHGSLQLWIDGCITEVERFKNKVVPPDPATFNHQVHKIRLFRQLIYDTDYKNASNVLHDPEFKIWSVDHSRAFRTHKELQNTAYLRRFSQALLDRLAVLDQQTLEDALDPWLSPVKIRALLARRDLILAHAAKEIEERGEKAVLYP